MKDFYMKNQKPQFNTKAIRQVIRANDFDISVEDVRKIRDKVNARIASGEVCCHICTSARRVFGNDAPLTEAVYNFMTTAIDAQTMESALEKFQLDFSGVTSEKADKLRQEFMRIWVDVKRNRKGKKQPTKPLAVGDRVVITDDKTGSGGLDGHFFQVGCKGVILALDKGNAEVEFDTYTCRGSRIKIWSVNLKAIKHENT